MVEIDRIWADNQQKADYESKVDALTAIRKEQTADISIIENPAKDLEVRIYWAADCSTTLTDCTTSCTLGGVEPEALCQDLSLDLCKEAGFSLTENRFRASNLSREIVVAKAMAKRMRELDEWLVQQLISKLNAFAGTNQFEGIADVDSDGTWIAASYWNVDLYGYFSQVAIMNRLNDPFMLHGGNLFQVYWQAQMNNLNTNNKDQLAKLQSLRSYWDMFNVDSVNSPDKVSYMISKGAVAFANKAHYPLNAPVQYFDDQRWSIESKALPGVYYDVYYNNQCIAGSTTKDVKHNWTLTVKAGIFKNPVGCNDDITGIIKFLCGTNADS